MENSGSITEFFYSLVPGILLLFLLHFHGHLNFIYKFTSGENSQLSIIFIYIILGLFIGFFLLAITKVIRNKYWNNKIASEVKSKNPRIWDKISKELYRTKSEDTPLNSIFLMDSYLRVDRPAFLPTLFSSRFTFWSNMAIVFSILFIINIIFHNFLDPKILKHTTIAYILLAGFSFYIANNYFYGFYDTIVKSYYMKKVHEKK